MNISRKRLTILLLIAFILLVALCFRTAWLQIVKSEELSKMASVQQTRDLNVTAKRGAIYDRNGEMHEYYHPDTGEGVNNSGFQSWNLLVNNMIAWLEGKQRVVEF